MIESEIEKSRDSKRYENKTEKEDKENAVKRTAKSQKSLFISTTRIPYIGSNNQRIWRPF